MASRSVVQTSLAVVAVLASFGAGGSKAAHDRIGGAPRLAGFRQLGAPVGSPGPGRRPDWRSIAWSPGGRYLVAAGTAGCWVWKWNVRTGREKYLWTHHEDGVGAVAWSPDGKLLATAWGDSGVRLWHSATGRLEQSLGPVIPHSGCGFYNLRWSPNGSRLAATGADNCVYVWNTITGREEARLAFGGPLVIDWSPNGRQVAVADVAAHSPDWHRIEATCRILDTATWRQQQVFQDRGFIQVAWRPDGKGLASISGESEQIRVWDPVTGRRVGDVAGYWTPEGEPVMADQGSLVPLLLGCIAWSPDGRFLASAGGGDRIVRISNAATGAELLTLGEGRGAVSAIAWSPDGKHLASCADDAVIRVWDLALPLT